MNRVHPITVANCSARADLGGGVVLDTHELDYLTWLLGPLREVMGMTVRSGTLDIETKDVAATCLWFDTGAVATVQADYIQRDYRCRYHITGDRGVIEWAIRRGVVSHYDVETEAVPAAAEGVNDLYVAQMRHVLDGIRGKCAPITPIAHAAQVMAFQLAVKQKGLAA